MLGVIGWIVFGLIVGIVAKLLMPGKDPGGFIITIVLGIVGALVGGFLGRALGLYEPEKPPASSCRWAAPSSSCSSTGGSARPRTRTAHHAHGAKAQECTSKVASSDASLVSENDLLRAVSARARTKSTGTGIQCINPDLSAGMATADENSYAMSARRSRWAPRAEHAYWRARLLSPPRSRLSESCSPQPTEQVRLKSGWIAPRQADSTAYRWRWTASACRLCRTRSLRTCRVESAVPLQPAELELPA